MNGLRVQGRLLSEADLQLIRQLRQDHPEWSRSRLSEQLVQHWQWFNEAGQPKDMAARSLLRKLQARGLLELPPPRTRNGSARRRARAPGLIQPGGLAATPEPIHGPLSDLQPIGLECVANHALRRRVAHLLQQYHYQGFAGPVGENVQYLVRDGRGRELALMVFGAAAWQGAARDAFIGWSAAQRRAGLSRLTNQQRFLLLPWVRVPHLASHVLALATGRLSADWQARYGHPVWLVETFVQEDRFEGTAYRAAGWTCVGQTTGRTRQDRHHTLQVPIKSVWVQPLHPRFREHLCAV